LCITATGNVGIGLTNPGALFQIISSSTSQFAQTTAIIGEAYALSASTKNPYSVAGTVVSYYTTNLLANAGLLFDLAPQNASGATNVYFGGVAGGTANGPANFVIGRRSAATSWVESFRIDTTGQVGIGSNSIPVACPLYVYSNTNSGWDGRGYFGNATAGFVCGYFTNGVNNSVLIGGHNAALNAWANLTIGGGTAITSFPSSVGIGTASPSDLLHVYGSGVSGMRVTTTNSLDMMLMYGNIGGALSTAVYVMPIRIGSTLSLRGGIYWDGTNLNYVNSSDYRLKENVVPMQHGLSRIMSLNPVTYNWIEQKTASEGFIAHEVQSIIPMAVSGEKDALDKDGAILPQGIDYSKIVVHLVSGMQEQQQLIAALQTQVQQLQQRLG
jgi:hypothetical protein